MEANEITELLSFVDDAATKYYESYEYGSDVPCTWNKRVGGIKIAYF